MWILIILAMVTLSFTQEFGKWRWANDTAQLTHDKEAHLVGSFGLYYMFRAKDYTAVESIFYSLCLGLAKETADALVPWEEYGSWGGDGFSKYDLYYNITGIGMAYTLDKLWKGKLYETKNTQVYFRPFRIDIHFN